MRNGRGSAGNSGRGSGAGSQTCYRRPRQRSHRGSAPVPRVPAVPEPPGQRRRFRLLPHQQLRLRTRPTTVRSMAPENAFGSGLFPLSAVRSALASADEQLALVGESTPVRIPTVEWAGWLADEAVRARYWASTAHHLPAAGSGPRESPARATPASGPRRDRGELDAEPYRATCTGTSSRTASSPASAGATTIPPSATPAITTPANNRNTFASAPRPRTERNGSPDATTPRPSERSNGGL
jgi:hypothetical protein